MACKFLLIGAVIALNVFVNHASLDPKYVQDLYNIYAHREVQPMDMNLPKVDPNDINMYLFTKENPYEFIRIDPRSPTDKLRGPQKIVFLIHGWLEHRNVIWYEHLTKALLNSRQGDYKVVQVDWHKPALELYSNSAYNTKEIGLFIGRFIQYLINNFNLSVDQFMLIGHSLGGQVSGFAGKTVYSLTGQTLPRIVALDPAGPLFTSKPVEERLNPTDAKVVHVIHTDGGTFGMKAACGTIDFFPNGGYLQPGCMAIDPLDPMTAPNLVLCNHQRSFNYFIEALGNPSGFLAKRCENWMEFKGGLCENIEAHLGDLTSNVRGKFYLETNRKAPFSKNTQYSAGPRILPIQRF